MATKTISKSALEDAIAEIWYEAQHADGSRAAMQDTLDRIQELCSDSVPDVEEVAEEQFGENSDTESDEEIDDE